MDQLVLKPGELFEDRYELIELLGRGGFSAVFLARDRQLQREVALKVLLPEPVQEILVGDEEDHRNRDSYIRRFQHEFDVISRLQDPAIIRVFDFGETDHGALFMVLEYVKGVTLNQWRSSGRELSTSDQVGILQKLLGALKEAHEKGILHRDIKPTNIMILPDEGEAEWGIRLLDFGIAKTMAIDDRTVMDLTKTGILVGTPRYMAPEQITNDEIGPAADIYALGLVMYELITGERGVPGTTAIEVLTLQIRPESVQLPDEVEVDDGLRRVVDKMLQKDLSRRFSSTEEILQELQLLEESQAARDLGTSGQTKGDPSSSGPETTEQAVTEEKKKRWFLPAGLVLLLALVVVGLVMALFLEDREVDPVEDSVAVVADSPVADSLVSEPMKDLEPEEEGASVDQGEIRQRAGRIVLTSVEIAEIESRNVEVVIDEEVDEEEEVAEKNEVIVERRREEPSVEVDEPKELEVGEPEESAAESEKQEVTNDREDSPRRRIRETVEGPLF